MTKHLRKKFVNAVMYWQSTRKSQCKP